MNGWFDTGPLTTHPLSLLTKVQGFLLNDSHIIRKVEPSRDVHLGTHRYENGTLVKAFPMNNRICIITYDNLMLFFIMNTPDLLQKFPKHII